LAGFWRMACIQLQGDGTLCWQKAC
jgi:hypothetical protein